MVFKAAYLARLGIQKTFTHGYIQSLVAASQSSSASHNTQFSSFSNNVFSYFAKPGHSTNAQNAHYSSSTGGTGAGPKTGHLDGNGVNEGGLAAYYAAWHKHQRSDEKDKDWHQFQFAKRIGWKPPTTIPEPQAEHAKAPRPTRLHERRNSDVIERAKSTSAVDDSNRKIDKGAIAAVQDDSVLVVRDEDALGRADEDAMGASTAAVVSSLSEDTQSLLGSAPSAAATDPSASPSSINHLSPVESTIATSISDAEPYTEHLTSLAENHKYADILAVFESMLKSGIKPSPSAYNALLLAAINLPKGKHHVVPKVLDVYSDMLRRGVSPDTATYTILIEVLAARALDVAAMRDELSQKQARYGGLGQSRASILRSDDTESRILAEDDSLSLAVKLFDTAAAVATSHLFTGETYRLLITACAHQNRINDMVRIYADMESRNVLAPTTIFSPMIRAFASTGDLRSSVECYDEYKALAMAHDNGEIDIARQDEEVYATLINAYAACGRMSGGLKFLGKIEDGISDSGHLQAIRDTVAVNALIPGWLNLNLYEEAISHAQEHMSPAAREQALIQINIHAADKNQIQVASALFSRLALTEVSAQSESTAATLAMLAMHIRSDDLGSARNMWSTIRHMPASLDLVEPTVAYTISLIRSDMAVEGLQEARAMFSRIRATSIENEHQSSIVERIDEGIEAIGSQVLHLSLTPPPTTSIGTIRLMVENGGVIDSMVEPILASIGPQEAEQLTSEDVNTLMHLQAGLLNSRPRFDVAHVERFTHLLSLLTTSVFNLESNTAKLIDQTLRRLDRPDLAARWQNLQQSPPAPLISPVSYQSTLGSPSNTQVTAYDDSFDPYGASTDFKGSTVIAEILEQTNGRHSAHLSEAMARFKNMRRIGRHPRYVTYAKLINAAAKDNRLSLAHDVLSMAKQDVPNLPGSRVVIQGWVSILDAMVGACLTVGKRDSANQYHQELLSMGAAPSANTFGLYITTLKESAKTFDEATEAVKIFHRAKAEGVEPSSFLYNALIGKLGKARRIDDCLLYFAEMRNLGIRPTSVTYGTIVNALCRVSDDKFAEELFEEMESMPNYKPRPAPYNSLMQYFLTTKRDRSKVLNYYDRMVSKNITPTMHTYKLLIDTHATLEPVSMDAAEAVLDDIRRSGSQPEAVHYASLIHAKGCVLHDLESARATFDQVISEGRIAPQASLYQAIFESLVANHKVGQTETLLQQMTRQRVAMTPYIANTLIHGWALEKDITKARAVFDSLGLEKREPSTYEAMTRAYLTVEDQASATAIVNEALQRGYPTAVANKICDLVGGGRS